MWYTPLIPVALVYRVDAQISRPAVGLRPAPLADRYRRRPGRLIAHPPLAVRPGLPQSVQLRHRQLRQSLILRILKIVGRPLQDLLRGRTTERAVGLIHRRQQFHILVGVAFPEAMTAIGLRLHLLTFQV